MPKQTVADTPAAAKPAQIDVSDLIVLREAVAERDAVIAHLRNRVLVLSQLIENAKKVDQ